MPPDFSWMDDAACRNAIPTSSFFPGPGETVPPEVEAVCARCPVGDQCRHHALVHGEFGWWGSSQKERRQVRSRNQLRVARITTHEVIGAPDPLPSINPEAARRRDMRRRQRAAQEPPEVPPDGIKWERR